MAIPETAKSANRGVRRTAKGEKLIEEQGETRLSLRSDRSRREFPDTRRTPLNLGLIRPGGFERNFAFEIIQEILLTPGPHDFAVRVSHVRLALLSRPPHLTATFVTIATRPSSAVRRAELNQ